MQNLLEIETHEITREMIEAGVSRLSELREFDPTYVAEEVFRVMARKISEPIPAPVTKR